MRLSILIPYLNDSHEFKVLSETLNFLSQVGDIGVTICDGGSSESEQKKAEQICNDNAWAYIKPGPANNTLSKVLESGVAKTSGDIVLFLPCDCRLTKELLLELKSVDSSILWGGFHKRYFHTNRLMRPYLWLLNNILAQNGMFVWTNGLFIRRSVFESLRWPEGSFLVDWQISQQLRKTKKYFFGKSQILVNERKYKENGSLKQILRNGLVILLYSIGIKDLKVLKNIYK